MELSAQTRRLLFWLPLAVAGIAGLAWLLRPQPVPVDLVTIGSGPIQVTVSDEGQTRVKDVFVVSAPLPGLMQRITLKAGDEVVAQKTVVARIAPNDPNFLDARSEQEARAALRRAEAERDFAAAELERFQRLAASGVISANDLDAARRRAQTTTAAVEEARARLTAPASTKRRRGPDCDCVDVYSPVSGRVLRVLQESEAVVAPGTALIEIGDPENLEVFVDLLSTDAVRVEPGQRVLVEAWGGGPPLSGRVRRIEPFGFTKISALGIEEQRVKVLIDFSDDRERWKRLGHGYRVEPRIVLAEADEVLKVPQAALFRENGTWSVFVDEGGRAELRTVELGLENGLEAQVLKGLAEGERVVLQPGGRVSAGTSIKPRA
ncbi:MAG: efflux RND transporter periplasmic adaptor subunit [Chromatiales bacterium]|nr:efflux RND transporter periplasmic adaptor subunit [Chromatiales bacterium]